MKVIDKRSNRLMRFEDIPVGTVIKIQSGLWLKTEPYVPFKDIDKDGKVNDFKLVNPLQLVRLEDGLFARGHADERVNPVDITVEIHDYNPDKGDEE